MSDEMNHEKLRDEEGKSCLQALGEGGHAYGSTSVCDFQSLDMVIVRSSSLRSSLCAHLS